MPSPELTDNDWTHINKGIELYNSGAFWESHEEWEIVWRRYPDEWRLFLQGLIQMAAGYHQLRRRIYHGVVKHLKNAREKLAFFPDGFLGVNVSELIDGMDKTLEIVKSKGSDGIDLVSVTCYPQIKLRMHVITRSL
jgi:predicted metal-dependent hydrolase